MKNKTIIYTIMKNKSLGSKVDCCPGVSRALNPFFYSQRCYSTTSSSVSPEKYYENPDKERPQILNENEGLTVPPFQENSKEQSRGQISTYYITGFTDGDGSFYVSLRKNDKLSTG